MMRIDLLSAVTGALSEALVVALLGARQVGKTTLAGQVMRAWPGKTEVARPSTHAGAGRIGAPPPARVRRMSPKTMIRLVTLNAAPTRNADV